MRVSLAPQLPLKYVRASASSRGVPPSMETFLSLVSATNAIQRPSGDRNGRCCIPSVSHMFHHRRKVVEDVLLVSQIPLKVPIFTVFATAAEVGHGVNKPLIEQHAIRRTESGRKADPVAAVPGDHAVV